MPLTVVVQSPSGDHPRLTFDGMQRIVIGRGPGCDVRLPDTTVSHRHASIRAQGADFLLFDEGSTNGTYVGQVPIAARTSRIVRSGDLVRLGRVWLELRIEQSPITRDVAAATRDLALSLVSRAMAARGEDATARVRVVEGADQGAVVALREQDRLYMVGRGPQCDLPISDPDVSREHVGVVRRDASVVVRDLGAKNGTWMGELRIEPFGEAAWRSSVVVRAGRTVLALEEPVGAALARLETEPDLPVAAEEMPARPPPPQALAGAASDGSAARQPAPAQGVGDMIATSTGEDAPVAAVAPAPGDAGRASPGRKRGGWSAADVAVMLASTVMLVLSVAGLVWLLR